MEPNKEGFGVQDSVLYTDGIGKEYLLQPAGGSVKPPSVESIKNREHFIYQDGKTVFKFAVTKMAEASAEVMRKNKLTGEDINYLLAHQANKRIIDATRDRMGIDESKVLMNIQRYGNTTSGTIPLLMWDFEKKLKKSSQISITAIAFFMLPNALYYLLSIPELPLSNHLGYVNIFAQVIIFCAVFIFSPLGIRLANNLSNRLIQSIFATLLLLIVIRYVVQIFY